MISLSIRRVITGLFILTFLICTPLLLLYSAGYRYDFKKESVSAVGSLSVTTEPRNVTVRLNGQVAQGQRSDGSLRFTNLTPGQYTVTIERDGYHSWRKQLLVEPNVTTFANEVVLFQTTDPQLATAISSSAAHTAPDQKLIALQTAEGLRIYNTANQQIVDTVSGGWQFISWAPDSSAVLLDDGAGQYAIAYINSDTPLLRVNTLLDAATIDSISWSNQTSYLLTVVSGNDIWQLNTITRAPRLVYQLPADQSYGSAVLFNNNRVYAIANTPSGSWLEQHDSDSGEVARLLQLPRQSHAMRFVVNNDMVMLHDAEAQTLLVVDQSFSSILLQTTAQAADWTLSGQALLFQRDNELWRWSAGGAAQFIDRYSQPITAVQQIPRSAYVLVHWGDQIDIVELDARDQVNVITIAESIRLQGLALSADGQQLWLIGQYDDQAGIFTHSLRR